MKATSHNIEYILESLHRMSLREDWDESSAQELVMEAGKLWEDYQDKHCYIVVDSEV